MAIAELLTYPAYALAYRSLAQVHGHAPLSLPIVARIVVAGFGPFALAGGFGIDKQALHALDEDERSAKIRVMALGVLEWAVLAPLGCGVSIVLLAQGSRIPASLLWPWAIGVPLGFTFAFWAAAPSRLPRLTHARRPRAPVAGPRARGNHRVQEAAEPSGPLRGRVDRHRAVLGCWTSSRSTRRCGRSG